MHLTLGRPEILWPSRSRHQTDAGLRTRDLADYPAPRRMGMGDNPPGLDPGNRSILRLRGSRHTRKGPSVAVRRL